MQNTKENIYQIAKSMNIDLSSCDVKMIQIHKATNILAPNGEALLIDFNKAKSIFNEPDSFVKCSFITRYFGKFMDYPSNFT